MAPCPGIVLQGLGPASEGRQGKLKKREAGCWDVRLKACRKGWMGYVGHTARMSFLVQASQGVPLGAAKVCPLHLPGFPKRIQGEHGT